MSFSTLLELESCPRRWALKWAEYSGLWEGRGYPLLPVQSSLEGTVVHRAIGRINAAISAKGCTSVRDASAVTALRELGGYTVVIKECIIEGLRSYATNPRALPVLETIRQRLTARLPELRSLVQMHVSRLTLGDQAPNTTRLRKSRSPMGRRPLVDGTYTELEVRDAAIGWQGFIDFLSLSATVCEIRDFKTGSPKPADNLQISAYAVLWSADAELNPTRRCANRLILSYSQHETEIPAPNDEAMAVLREELRQRTATALESIAQELPDARPGVDNCAFCPVRHLCDEYWNWLPNSSAVLETPQPYFSDVEVTLTGRHGPLSWDGCMYDPIASRHTNILMRTANLQFELRTGQRLRLLNVHINVPQQVDDQKESHICVVKMGTTSEAFLCSP
ncbi:PD-(D/E)XK nuclease family protein [Bythopirellula goksoeyrii]|nr:PD-(D/E)XK nuclease family protein [Bythopirellula goksoeyrii]